uniref:Uncharacterized protein n=1 Tax=Nicotiana tabacum TaxID=4097 RepID=A0A1S3YT64_TOBAC|nr:PREDICTED: uncharacterized protein LOC107779281 [Nicotiana tabacum]
MAFSESICLGANQEWIEDPTNRSALFTRDRIRMTLTDLASPIFRSELQALISACRRTRSHVDKMCSNLLHQAVTIMPVVKREAVKNYSFLLGLGENGKEGYAVIALGILRPSDLKDIVLSKFIALLLQTKYCVGERFSRPVSNDTYLLMPLVSGMIVCFTKAKTCQRQCIKIIVELHSDFPMQDCCYCIWLLPCPAPGSRGTKVLVCRSTDADLTLEFLNPYFTE